MAGVAHIYTVAFAGIDAREVDVQVQMVAGGKHYFNVVGLADKAVADALTRVEATTPEPKQEPQRATDDAACAAIRPQDHAKRDHPSEDSQDQQPAQSVQKPTPWAPPPSPSLAEPNDARKAATAVGAVRRPRARLLLPSERR